MSFFLLMLIITLSANFYVFYRLWHIVPAGSIVRPLLVVFGIVMVCTFFTGMLGRGFLPVPVTSLAYKTGTSWFFICLYFLMLFLLIDLLRLTHLVQLDKFIFGNWVTFGAVTGIIAIVMIGGYFNYRHKERVELAVTVNKNTDWKKPLKIVALSDLHLGFTIGKKELEQWIELVNKENPDIVLLAGDVIDNNLEPLIEQDMTASFRKINSKYGVYTALGNHEYIAGVSESLVFFRQAGITVLKDSAVLVNDEFYLVGREDKRIQNRKTLEELTGSLDHSKPIILLDHQPFHLEEAEKNKIDLQISGHTHRGQVLPISWITDHIYEQSHGYLKKGNSHIYVSSGMGIWGGKFRIGTQSEYVVIYLSSE
ncbi:MAG: metallophosphoesterase [Prevotellaceae bacterium]|nr:metallophosphoesterase [Prevotellaceae bacterium]